MPRKKTLIIFTTLSVLFHVAVFLLVYLFPVTPPRREEVMEVDLADIPRSADFLPPKPGIIEGQRPKAPPKPAPKAPPAIPPREMIGRVPDLPVKTELPPEKSFPAPQPKAETPQAKTEEPPQAKAAEPRRAPAEEPAGGAGKEAPSPGDSPRSLRDLTPSLGKLVMAREEPSGGRGKSDSHGSAAGTGGKASDKEGVAEESGGGFRLTALNAPEIQYISYFASIKRKIELVWQYPYEAMQAGVQGELQIDFVIARSGKVESVSLVRGSGSRILDDEAVRSIRKAAPFDPIPAEYRIDSLQIRGRFVYTYGGPLRFMR